MEYDHKKSSDITERVKESSRIRQKYPDKYPVIVEANNGGYFSKKIVLDKNKYLVPGEFQVGQFLHILRKRVELESSQGMFLYIGDNVMAPTSSLMSQVYDEYKDEDGFLYCKIAIENTFGFDS